MYMCKIQEMPLSRALELLELWNKNGTDWMAANTEVGAWKYVDVALWDRAIERVTSGAVPLNEETRTWTLGKVAGPTPPVVPPSR